MPSDCTSCPKIASHFHAAGVRLGHIAAIDIAAVNDRNRHIGVILVNYEN